MAQLAAFNTMTAIKKKLHGMKQKREEAFDKADQLEQKLIEQRAISEKVSYTTPAVPSTRYVRHGVNVTPP